MNERMISTNGAASGQDRGEGKRVVRLRAVRDWLNFNQVVTAIEATTSETTKNDFTK
jgi:hypothetical protein